MMSLFYITELLSVIKTFLSLVSHAAIFVLGIIMVKTEQDYGKWVRAVFILPDALAVNMQDQFNHMAAVLGKVIETSVGIRRELAFRSVMTTRNSLCMLFKYACFRLGNTPDMDEWYAVKSWISRKIKQRQFVSVE